MQSRPPSVTTEPSRDRRCWSNVPAKPDYKSCTRQQPIKREPPSRESQRDGSRWYASGDGVPEFVWWDDNETAPRTIDLSEIGLSDEELSVARLHISQDNLNAFAFSVINVSPSTSKLFAMGRFGVRSFASAVEGQPSIVSPSLVGQIEGDLIVRVTIKGSGETPSRLSNRPATLRWNAQTNSVSWLVAAIDEGPGLPVFAQNDFVSSRRNQDWYTAPTLAGRANHNGSLPGDVNLDGVVSALDALNVINWLSRQTTAGETSSSSTTTSTISTGLWMFDVSNDQKVSAIDALMIINQLGRQTTLEPEAFSLQWLSQDKDDAYDHLLPGDLPTLLF